MRFKPVADFSVPGKIILNVPAFIPTADIIAPRDTHSMEWLMIAMRCNTMEKTGRSIDPSRISKRVLKVDYNKDPIPVQRLELPSTAVYGDIVLVIIALKYFTMEGKELVQVMEKRWLPVGVVGVSYKE